MNWGVIGKAIGWLPGAGIGGVLGGIVGGYNYNSLTTDCESSELA